MANGFLGNIYVMKRVEKIFEIGFSEVYESKVKSGLSEKMSGLSTDRVKNSDS